MLDVLRHDLDVHRRLARLTSALAIDAVLPDHYQRVSQDVERHGEASAFRSVLKLRALDRLLVFVEDGW